MRPRWDNISLTLGCLVLLWLVSVILDAVTAEEVIALVFPADADERRVRFLLEFGVLITAALLAVIILRGPSRRGTP